MSDRTPEKTAQIEDALRAVKVYVTQAHNVIINFPKDDENAVKLLIEAFGFAGGTPYKLGETTWMDRSLPSHIYDLALPICLEQQAELGHQPRIREAA